MDWLAIVLAMSGTFGLGLIWTRPQIIMLKGEIERLELQLSAIQTTKDQCQASTKFHPNRVEVKREAIPVLDAVETWWQEYRSGEPHLIVRDPDLIPKILDMVEKKPKRPWSDPPRPKK